MKDKDKTKEQLIVELVKLRRQFATQKKLEEDLKQAEETLKENKEKYKTAIENISEIIQIVDSEGVISYTSPSIQRILGYKPEEVIGRPSVDFVHPDDLQKVSLGFEEAYKKPDKPTKVECRCKHKNGTWRVIEGIGTNCLDKPSINGFLSVMQDITERKKTEEQIKASLKEKEVLLREIHHRVKNNMQIVSSLLHLQSAKAEDKKTKEIFIDCQNRIRTMAIIHEKLYQSKDFTKINFAQYIDRLAVHINHSYGVDSNIIALKTDLEEVFLDLNRAIPCGLIANELLSNSVKHAFPEGKKGEICIKLYSDKKGMITLVVSDDGIGFPKDIDFRKASSLGLQMVNDLTKQIDGTIELDRTGGTSFKVEFSVSK